MLGRFRRSNKGCRSNGEEILRMTEVSGGKAGFLYSEEARRGASGRWQRTPASLGIRGDLGAGRERIRMEKLEVGGVEGLSLVTPRIA